MINDVSIMKYKVLNKNHLEYYERLRKNPKLKILVSKNINLRKNK